MISSTLFDLNIEEMLCKLGQCRLKYKILALALKTSMTIPKNSIQISESIMFFKVIHANKLSVCFSDDDNVSRQSETRRKTKG